MRETQISTFKLIPSGCGLVKSIALVLQSGETQKQEGWWFKGASHPSRDRADKTERVRKQEKVL